MYYYKNEEEQDPVVKVSAMQEMFQQVGTPENWKKEIPMPTTGDHVIASPFKSKDAPAVEKEIINWLLHLKSNHPGWFIHLLEIVVSSQFFVIYHIDNGTNQT